MAGAGAEMMGTCALTFRVCSTACGSASETLDPCMPERGEIRQTGFRNSSPQKQQPGVQDPHHLHLPEDQGKLLQHSEPWFSSLYENTCLIPSVAFLIGSPLCLESFAHILLSLGEVSGTLLWVRVHLVQGTWKPSSHFPPTPLSHLPHPADGSPLQPNFTVPP